MVLAVTLIRLTVRHPANQNRLEIQSDSHMATKQEMVAQIDQNLGQTTISSAMSSRPPKAQTTEELRTVAETLHEPGKRQEVNQTGDAITSSVYPVVHNHMMGSCKGSLIIDADSIEYLPEGKSKDGFRFRLRDTISVARGDSLKIQFSTKTYTFKAGFDKTKEEQRAQVNAIYQQLTQSKATANLGP